MQSTTRAYVFLALFLGLGLAALVYGGVGLISGEITIRPKNAAAYVASASGPNSNLFYALALSSLLVGVVLAASSLVAIATLAFGNPYTRLRLVQAIANAQNQKSTPLGLRSLLLFLGAMAVAVLLVRYGT